MHSPILPAAAAALLLSLLAPARAHMIFNTPSTWGLTTQGGDLEKPLNAAFGSNWPHHGAKKDTEEVITLTPGSNPSFPITCGEVAGSPDKASGACKTKADFHGGGGCALSIAYNSGGTPKPEDFVVFSVTHDCPTFNKFNHNFAVPANLPACESCVCAWHWVPDPGFAADESYMNTFNCAVGGTTKGKITGGKQPNYFGVSGYEGGGKRPMYKSTFPEGAQKLTVGAAGKRWVA